MTRPGELRDQILGRAARCYQAAGLLDDACRCLERVGQLAEAARLHEHAGRWVAAGQAYERAGQPGSAARCFSQAERWQDAERNLEADDQVIEAAWLLAHRLQRYQRARALVRAGRHAVSERSTDSAEHWSRALVEARCDLGSGARKAAARTIRTFAEALPGLQSVWEQSRLLTRAREITGALGRPDLALLLHAAACSAGLPEASEQWEVWALERLGTAEGVPLPPEVDQGEPVAPAQQPEQVEVNDGR